MSEPKHTPGPWYASHDFNNPITHRQGWGVGRIGQAVAAVESERTEADARLIAAAPELLEACVSALDVWTRIDIEDEVRARAQARNFLRTAIAKAEGGDV